MPRPINRDITRLPEWAQQRILTLEEDAARARAEALVATTPGASNTQLNDYLSQQKLGLPPFSRVRFGTENSWIEVHLLNREAKSHERLDHPSGETVIEVSSATGRISVHPCVSNVVRIKMEER